jgi:hypothetical protein
MNLNLYDIYLNVNEIGGFPQRRYDQATSNDHDRRAVARSDAAKVLAIIGFVFEHACNAPRKSAGPNKGSKKLQSQCALED